MGTAARNEMNYEGPERRHHRVLVTHNSEYHMRGETCVGVRDRRTGRWIDDHQAIGTRLEGAVRVVGDAGLIPHLGTPEVGESAMFDFSGRELVTSRIERIERPAREIVAHYPRG